MRTGGTWLARPRRVCGRYVQVSISNLGMPDCEAKAISGISPCDRQSAVVEHGGFWDTVAGLQLRPGPSVGISHRIDNRTHLRPQIDPLFVPLTGPTTHPRTRQP